MNILRRAVDRLRHPGEGQTQRAYRRWRDYTGRGEPYRLPHAVREGGPWMARPHRDPIESMESMHLTDAGRRAVGLIVGARIVHIGRRDDDQA